jgi:hypothetical protein
MAGDMHLPKSEIQSNTWDPIPLAAVQIRCFPTQDALIQLVPFVAVFRGMPGVEHMHLNAVSFGCKTNMNLVGCHVCVDPAGEGRKVKQERLEYSASVSPNCPEHIRLCHDRYKMLNWLPSGLTCLEVMGR